MVTHRARRPRSAIAGAARTVLGEVRVAFRDSISDAERVREFRIVTVEELIGAAPWRTFRWRHGQPHYAGTYWSATEHDHVHYESRLEVVPRPDRFRR